MKGITSKVCESIKKPIYFSLFINSVVLLVSLFVFKPFFEENDDAFISMIAEGVYGAKETHLIYVNVILGYIYKGLYSLCSVIRWHSVLQILFLFIAFNVLTYILQQYKHGKILSVFVVLASFYESYVSIQYSKSATIISVIGYIALFEVAYMMRRKADSKTIRALTVCGFGLLIYGMLLRDSSFFLASIFMLIIGLYELYKMVREAENDRGTIVSGIIQYCKLFVPLMLILLVFLGINKAYYNSDTDWKNFMIYNDTRMELLDYRYDLLDYNKYGDTLNEMGVSENDALLYLTWQFGDDTVLDVPAMRMILDQGIKRKLDVDFAKAFVKNLYDDVFVVNPLFMAFLVMVIVALHDFIKGKKIDKLIAYLAILAVFGAILLYYQYSGRWSHRIVFAAMLIIPTITAYIFRGDIIDMVRMNVRAATGLIAIFSIIALLGNRFDYNEWKRNGLDYRGFLTSICENEDELYVADTFTFQYAYRYDVFKTYPEGAFKNFVAVGSWFMNSPITKNITESFGYSNPYEALASESDKVILVDNMYEIEKIRFLNDHYGGGYTNGKPEQAFGFTLYNIVK